MSDWSSDVCSSDLPPFSVESFARPAVRCEDLSETLKPAEEGPEFPLWQITGIGFMSPRFTLEGDPEIGTHMTPAAKPPEEVFQQVPNVEEDHQHFRLLPQEIGRESCRERVCQNV